jgi:hypothetical protein
MADLQEKSIELWREEAWRLHWKLRKAEDALRKIKDLHDQVGPEDEQVIMIRDDMTYFIVCEALGMTP